MPKGLPGNDIYGVCDLFLREEREKGRKRYWGADRIAKWLSEKTGRHYSREQVFPIIRQGVSRGYIKLCPPRELELRRRILHRFPNAPDDTRVFELYPPNTVDNLAAQGAEVVLELIQRVWHEKKARHRGPSEDLRVHLGFGAGGTTQRVARSLSRLLASEFQLPPLTCHALSSGFDPHAPLTAPVAFFSYFQDLDVRFVGLFSTPVFPWKRYGKLQELPGIRESFAAAQQIDIVITSLADARDEHGLLNRFLAEHGGDEEVLRRHGHVGDILWQPYSASGPIEADTGIRAVTLFDLAGLRELVETGRHVVLIAGPCVACEAPKSAALAPLLELPRLGVFNHLVTDATTARAVLDHGAARISPSERSTA